MRVHSTTSSSSEAVLLFLSVSVVCCGALGFLLATRTVKTHFAKRPTDAPRHGIICLDTVEARESGEWGYY